MKVLIINYRYFVSGGPERYLFNLKSLLEEKGHEVIPFSVRYKQNLPSEYDKYFAEPITTDDEVYFREHTWNIGHIVKGLRRSFYSKWVYKNLNRLIKDTQPDFAIVLHYLRKLSPSVLTALNDNKIPFVVRLSDFGMICPNAHLIRDNQVCELCIKGSLLNSVKYRCVQNSLGASVVNYLATKYHEFKGYYSLIPYFIVPSNFTKGKMIEAGFDQSKLLHIPTFVKHETFSGTPKKNNILYIGRLDKTKGLSVLLNAIKYINTNYTNINFECTITGDGENNYVKGLKSFVERNKLKTVKFIGHVDKRIIDSLIKDSLALVAPSIWYDNLPNAILESFAFGRPVIASNIGSLPELVVDGKTGLLFEPGDSKDLADKIIYLIQNPDVGLELGRNAAEKVKRENDQEIHYEKIMNVYNELKRAEKIH
jgi:glycosyltransferase involved in cell wall biosynthesis